MPDTDEERKPPLPPPGMVSEGGVDERTGAITGAMAGAVLGGSLGPVGLAAGALIGAVAGGAAARGKEHPPYPEHWEQERSRLQDKS
jgi:uncharacterized membrane protein